MSAQSPINGDRTTSAQVSKHPLPESHDEAVRSIADFVFGDEVGSKLATTNPERRRKSLKVWWPGAELNRRHADFQIGLRKSQNDRA
jgi:hypothetical protein